MREFGLIGKTLTHSYSQQYFERKFRSANITDATYGLFPLGSIEQLPDLLIAHPDLQGLNVTIPFKQDIIPLVHSLAPDAAEIGAVNCVRIRNNKLEGFNTDTFGFDQSLKPFIEPVHDRALILGTGGAAKAVAWVLTRRGIPFLFVSRNKEVVNGIRWEQLDRNILIHHPLIINATPMGMYPDEGSAPPLPYEHLTSRHFCVDLVYNPEMTLFLKNAADQGAMVLNGLSMLQLQAEKSWEIWNSD